MILQIWEGLGESMAYDGSLGNMVTGFVRVSVRPRGRGVAGCRMLDHRHSSRSPL